MVMTTKQAGESRQEERERIEAADEELRQEALREAMVIFEASSEQEAAYHATQYAGLVEHSVSRFREYSEIGERMQAVANSWPDLPAHRAKHEFDNWVVRQEKEGRSKLQAPIVKRSRALYAKAEWIEKEIGTLSSPDYSEQNRRLVFFNLQAWAAGRIWEEDKTEAEKAPPIPKAPANMTDIRATFRNSAWIPRELHAVEPATTPYDTSVRIRGPNLYLHHGRRIEGVYVKLDVREEPAHHRTVSPEETRWMECVEGSYPIVETEQDAIDLMTEWGKE